MVQIRAACILLITYLNVVSSRIITVKQIKQCIPNKTYPYNMSASNKIVDEKQYHDWKFVLSKPFTDNADLTFVAEKVFGTKSKKMIAMKSKGACSALSKYGDEIYRELAVAIKIPVGKCPIAKGSYHLKSHPIDFDLNFLRILPKGAYRLIVSITENAAELFCIHVDIEKQ